MFIPVFILLFSVTACFIRVQWFETSKSVCDNTLIKILNIDPRQKQLKLEETDNAIIKSILSSRWQNFLLFLPQMVVDQEADKRFS